MPEGPYDYSFDQNDYEMIIRLYNGENDVYLKPEAWDNLLLEEDIFDWPTKGSIVIKSEFNSLERESDEAITATGADRKNLVYKFRNDGRDTIYITIMPKSTAIAGLTPADYKENLWRIELEAVIYDVEDFTHTNITDKCKRLYFWEKTYQMMQEKNIEFTTANVGDNKGKANIHKLSNEDRSLKSGSAIAELLKNDEDFKKNATKTDDATQWNPGDELSKVFYSSASNNTFLDDLQYLLSVHTASQADDNQPCIFKLERPEAKGKPRQFSLKSIKQYFEKAGKDTPGDYQIEQLFLQEHSETVNPNEVVISKAPTSTGTDVNKNIKGADFSEIRNYQLVDFSGADYNALLGNRFVVSHNMKDGQFNIEIVKSKSEIFKDFAKQNILNQVLTNTQDDRLPLTRYMTTGYNSTSVFSPRQLEKGRYVDARNKMLKHYLFSNLGIAFNLRGLTIRQPGRFFGLSKKAKNDKDHDDLIEGQYFITNIKHEFSTSTRTYSTSTVAVKVHKFKETAIQPSDVIIIS